MRYAFVRCLVLASFFTLCIHPVLLAQASPYPLRTAAFDATMQEKLKKNYEQNANELMTHIRKDNVDEVENFIDYVIKNKIVTRHGEDYFFSLLDYWFDDTYSGVSVDEALLAHLDAWVNKNQESVIARLIRGDFYVSWAWKARGHGWAKDVEPENWKIFHERLDKAVHDYLYVYSVDSANIYAHVDLFNLSVVRKKPDTLSVDFYQKALEQDPNNFFAHRIRLKQLMPKWGGSWPALFKFARETEKKAPEKTLLPLILAYAHKEAAARSNNRNAYYASPEVWADIERVYKTVIAAFPQSGQWKTEFALLADRVGKRELTREYAFSAIEVDPHHRETCRLVLWFCVQDKNWELEEKYAKWVTDLYPYYTPGYSYLGQASVDLKKYPEAVAAYTRAIELDPENAGYRTWLCWTYNSMKEFEKAIDACTGAIALCKDDASPYKQRAYAYKQLGKTKEAAADSKRHDEIVNRNKDRK